jgi:hypothetical protein
LLIAPLQSKIAKTRQPGANVESATREQNRGFAGTARLAHGFPNQLDVT